MKLHRLKWSLIWFVIFVLVGCSRNPYHEKQIALAKELKVGFTDSSVPITFPVSYYYEVLKVGMSIDEVHKTIINYEEVYACGEYKEVYYYFSKEDNEALIFRILYDKDTQRFEMIQGEERNSRYINVENCVKGRKLNQ